jgi:hypothetical protein
VVVVPLYMITLLLPVSDIYRVPEGSIASHVGALKEGVRPRVDRVEYAP